MINLTWLGSNSRPLYVTDCAMQHGPVPLLKVYMYPSRTVFNVEILTYFLLSLHLFRFPKYMPPGLFEMLSVRAHREKHSLKFLAHWGGGFHARHKKENVQVMILDVLSFPQILDIFLTYVSNCLS